MTTDARHSHQTISNGGLHGAVALEYADETARLAATGFDSFDVYKLAIQLDTNDVYMLVDDVPITWALVGGGGVSGQLNKVRVQCRKSTAGTLPVGTVVYATGYDTANNRALVDPAKADSATTLPASGIIDQAATDTSDGSLLIIGVIEGLNTNALPAQTPIYVSHTTAGEWVGSPPPGPYVTQALGVVLKQDLSDGVLGVNTLGFRSIEYTNTPQPAGVSAIAGTANTSSASDHVHLKELADENTVFYVGKHGNDSNSGKNISNAFLTFGAAIAEAQSQSPSAMNPFTIVSLDTATYIESITGVPYVNIYAPTVNLMGGLTLADRMGAALGIIIAGPGQTAVSKNVGTETSSVKLIGIAASGSANGIINDGADSVIIAKVDYIRVDDGNAVEDNSSGDGHTHLEVSDIYLYGDGKGLVTAGGAGKIYADVDEIENLGSGTTTGIDVQTGKVRAYVTHLDCDTAYDVSTGAEMEAFFGSVSGSTVEDGTVNVTIAGQISAHQTTHNSGGSDALKLDDLASPDDNTDLDATISAHGLLPKLGGGSTNFLRADGTWSAPISGQIIYDAIVAPSGGDYTTLKAAVDAGNQSIFVRSGTYNETGNISVPLTGIVIDGEADAIINFAATYRLIVDGGSAETAGTISGTTGSTTITGSGTTFTNLSSGDFIRIGTYFAEIDSITNATILELVEPWYGDDFSGLSYIAQAMVDSVVLRRLIIENGGSGDAYFRACKNVFIENCTFRNSGSGNGIDFENSGDVYITQTKVQDNQDRGIEISGCSNLLVADSSFSNNANNGVRIDNDCENVSFKASSIINNDNHGVWISGGNNTRFIGCAILRNDGIGIEGGGTYFLVDGSQIQENGIAGVSVGADYSTITNSQFVANGSDSVRVAGTDVVISNNVIRDGGSKGVEVQASADRTLISNNVITGCSSDGIEIDSSNNLITGNYVAQNSADGIEIGATSDSNTLSGNVLTGNGTDFDDNGTNTVILDLAGPSTSTDEAIARFDGTTGKVLQNSNATITDAGVLTVTGSIQSTSGGVTANSGAGSFGSLNSQSNITVSGTVDGRDVAADGIAQDNHIASTSNPHSTDVGNLGSGTLAELNTTITDATLDDSSDSRTPTGAASGDLGGTYPSPTVNDGADSTAIHDNISGEITAITEKTTPVSGDWFLIEDSQSSNTKKKLSASHVLASVDDLATVCARRSTSFTGSTSYADVTFDQTDVESNTDVISHHNTITDRIYVYETGLYLISYYAVFDPGASVTTMNGRIRINDSTVISQSQTMTSDDDEEQPASITFVEELTANDYISLQLLVSISSPIEAGTVLSVVRLKGSKGAKGDKGDTGSGSSITLKADNSTITGSPFDTLDFHGAIEGVDEGSDEARIVLWGDSYQFAASEGQSSTTSSTFQQKLRLTTPSLDAGDYYIQWFFEHAMGGDDKQLGWRVQVDDTTTVTEAITENKGQFVDSQWRSKSGFYVATLTAAAHTIDLDYRDVSGDTAYIRRARLTIWRVS